MDLQEVRSRFSSVSFEITGYRSFAWIARNGQFGTRPKLFCYGNFWRIYTCHIRTL